MGGWVEGNHVKSHKRSSFVHDCMPMAAAVGGLEPHFPKETLGSWETVLA